MAKQKSPNKTIHTEQLKTYKDTNTYNKKNHQELSTAILAAMSVKTNLYQKIYNLITTEPDTWRQFDFLSSENKDNRFVEKIEREIKNVKSDNFNYQKYQPAIGCILGMRKIKFNEAIIKNMYVAKLQNILFLLKEAEGGSELNESKNNSTDLYR